MEVDLKCIKCGMEKISALNAKSRLVNLAFEGGERKWGKDKSGILGQFLGNWENTKNSGKGPKIK